MLQILLVITKVDELCFSWKIIYIFYQLFGHLKEKLWTTDKEAADLTGSLSVKSCINVGFQHLTEGISWIRTKAPPILSERAIPYSDFTQPTMKHMPPTP